MTKEEKLKIFEEELNLITNEELKMVVKNFLIEQVPEYFWIVPASSSGKYHPNFTLGENGLVRHTKMVIAVALELRQLNMFDTTGVIIDDIVVACLLHDTFKKGIKDCGHTSTVHADIAAAQWEAYAVDKLKPIYREDIYRGIKTHMGQWSAEKQPSDDFEKLIHLADFIASRKFFDKFNN